MISENNQVLVYVKIKSIKFLVSLPRIEISLKINVLSKKIIASLDIFLLHFIKKFLKFTKLVLTEVAYSTTYFYGANHDIFKVSTDITLISVYHYFRHYIHVKKTIRGITITGHLVGEDTEKLEKSENC